VSRPRRRFQRATYIADVPSSSDDTAPPFTYHELRRARSSKPIREWPRLVTRAIRLVLAAGRRNTIALAVVAAVQAALALVQLGLIQRLLREFPAVSDGASVRVLVPEVVAFVIVYAVQSSATLVDNQLRQVLGEEVARHAQSLVARAAASADLLDYERPGFHDRLQRALANASSRPLQTTFAVVNLASSTFMVVAVMAALLSVAPLLVPLMVVAFAPLWLLLRRLTRLGFEFSLAESEADRRRSYLLWLLTSKELATELRSYQLASEFDRRHDALWDGRLGRLRALTRRRIRLGLLGRLSNSVLLGAILAVLLWMVSSGRADVADAGVAAGALVVLSQRLSSFVGSTATLYECALFLDDMEAFLHDQQRLAATRATGDLAGGLTRLEARGVTFRYPAGARDALRGVDLHVEPGEMVALVGVNGSGKTTLAKVLAGLLPPSAGCVAWNGADLASVDPDVWRANVAIVFQDFARYLLTLRENVTFGRVTSADGDEATTAAIAAAGASELVAELPQGLDNILGPQFIGGNDLSGGQWQRVALARAFFRDAPVLILDEPSAALDAEAEAALFDRVRVLCEGRAVVVISHRFSTVTRADRIYVLDNGAVIESGTHEQLLAQPAEYARLFHLQAQQYAIEPR
jgi:ATP-binding cassette subfamily B protein